MKKRFLISILLVCVLALCMVFVSCSNGGGGGGSSNNVITAEWTGTYVAGTSKFTLNGNGSGVLTGWKGSAGGITNGTYTGFGISTGGTISGSGYSGTWVYLTQDGDKIGIIGHFSPAHEGNTYFLRAGDYDGWGVPGLISEADSMGITFTPTPSGSWYSNAGFTGFR